MALRDAALVRLLPLLVLRSESRPGGRSFSVLLRELVEFRGVCPGLGRDVTGAKDYDDLGVPINS